MAFQRFFPGNVSKARLEEIVKRETVKKKKAKETIKEADIVIRGAKAELERKAEKKK